MILADGLDCDDERGWQRLANPLSGILRNSVFLLLYGTVMLWGDLSVWFQILVWPALLFVVVASVRAVPPTERDSWHARAIYGERILACYGWGDDSDGVKQRMFRVKVLEAFTGLVLLVSAFLGWPYTITGAFIGFMVCRFWSLRLTERVCRKAVERAQ